MKFLKSRGIIIKKTKLKDADIFITIFTKDRGKLVLFAKSARNIKSSRIAKLDLFSNISFNYLEINDRLTLTQVDLIKSYSDSKSNLKNITRLFEIGELIDKLLPENEPNEKVFNLIITALDHLHKFDTADYLKRFKNRLLNELGYGESSNLEDLDNKIESIIESPLKARKLFR